MRPIARWNPARDVWEIPDSEGLLCEHLDVYSGTFPTSGMTVAGMAYALPTSGQHTEGSASSLLLPTPAAYDGERGGPQDPAKRKAGGHSVTLQDAVSCLSRE